MVGHKSAQVQFIGVRLGYNAGAERALPSVTSHHQISTAREESLPDQSKSPLERKGQNLTNLEELVYNTQIFPIDSWSVTKVGKYSVTKSHIISHVLHISGLILWWVLSIRMNYFKEWLKEAGTRNISKRYEGLVPPCLLQALFFSQTEDWQLN